MKLTKYDLEMYNQIFNDNIYIFYLLHITKMINNGDLISATKDMDNIYCDYINKCIGYMLEGYSKHTVLYGIEKETYIIQNSNAINRLNIILLKQGLLLITENYHTDNITDLLVDMTQLVLRHNTNSYKYYNSLVNNFVVAEDIIKSTTDETVKSIYENLINYFK